jgi:5-methylcytosine-specific restriction endonuclease McrA
MALKTLKPRIKTATNRIKTMSANPTATPRLRGRAGVEARARWLRAHPLCVMCHADGVIAAASIVDHIIPLALGGRDDDTNKQSLCDACHIEKTKTDGSQRWREQSCVGSNLK